MPQGRRGWRAASVGAADFEAHGNAADLVAMLGEQHVRTLVLDEPRFRPRAEGLDASAAADLDALVGAAHAAGMRVLPVADSTIPDDPAWDAYRDEVAVAGAAEDEATGCPAGAWADYLVAAVARAMDDHGIDGVHLRGVGAPRGCASEAHGCGYDGDEGRHATWDVAAAREMMRRLRNVVKSRRPEGLLTVEAEAGAVAPVVAFADGLVCSAADAAGAPLSLDAFAAALGTAVGLPTEVLVQGDDAAVRNALALALAHGVALRPTGETLAAADRVWEAKDAFDIDTATWVPYWSERTVVTSDAADTAISAHVRRGEALAAVANRAADDRIVQLSLNRRVLHLGQVLTATDLLTGEAAPQVGEALRLRLAPLGPALVIIGSETMEAASSDE